MNYQKLSSFSTCLHVFSTMALGSMEIFSVFFNYRDRLTLILGLFMIIMGIVRIWLEIDLLSYSVTHPKGYVFFNTILSFLLFLMTVLYGAGLLI